MKKGRGKKGGKGAGRGKGDKGGLASRTPDGRMICFKYNDRNSKCDGRCNMVHVCRVKGCYQKHPMYECTMQGGAAAAAAPAG